MDVLRRSEIFLGLSDEALNKIVNDVPCAARIFQAGEMVFDIGDPARELFIIEDGQVDLIITQPLPERQTRIKATIDTVWTGGTFGWSSLIPPYTYTLSARCMAATRVLALNGRELVRFFDREPVIGYEVMKALNQIISFRLRDTARALFHIIASGIKV